jgi:hypothetical protein
VNGLGQNEKAQTFCLATMARKKTAHDASADHRGGLGYVFSGENEKEKES